MSGALLIVPTSLLNSIAYTFDPFTSAVYVPVSLMYTVFDVVVANAAPSFFIVAVSTVSTLSIVNLLYPSKVSVGNRGKDNVNAEIEVASAAPDWCPLKAFAMELLASSPHMYPLPSVVKTRPVACLKSISFMESALRVLLLWNVLLLLVLPLPSL